MVGACEPTLKQSSDLVSSRLPERRGVGRLSGRGSEMHHSRTLLSHPWTLVCWGRFGRLPSMTGSVLEPKTVEGWLQARCTTGG